VTGWLAEEFEPPARVELPTGHHLRPISPSDIDLDHPAVMGSQARLWTIFGPAWGWPPATMTREQDLEDLVRHADEMVRLESFNYAVFDRDETALLGCVYIDPPEKAGGDAEISWWVVDAEVGGALEAALAEAVPEWIAREWPFLAPRYIGVDLTWAEYLALPDLEAL
jgi:RimJ/RimL family protein N-acetyltransferase